MRATRYVYDAERGCTVPVYDCYLCMDNRFVVVPKRGVEWNPQSCYIGHGAAGRVAVPCPMCCRARFDEIRWSYANCDEREVRAFLVRFRKVKLRGVIYQPTDQGEKIAQVSAPLLEGLAENSALAKGYKSAADNPQRHWADTERGDE